MRFTAYLLSRGYLGFRTEYCAAHPLECFWNGASIWGFYLGMYEEIPCCAIHAMRTYERCKHVAMQHVANPHPQGNIALPLTTLSSLLLMQDVEDHKPKVISRPSPLTLVIQTLLAPRCPRLPLLHPPNHPRTRSSRHCVLRASRCCVHLVGQGSGFVKQCR
jgi:hypothetical protein